MKHQPKKRFGQNFLRDKNLLKKIVDKANIRDKNVIEIGPGQGALTRFLAEQAKSVIAYEIDYTLEPILSEIKSEHENLEVHFLDFLTVDLSLLKESYHLVANVPYYITTPILFKFLEEKHILSATMMIQKEVCDRLTSKPNERTYNALSVIVNAQAFVEKIMDVKRTLFYPVPNVDSSVIKITKRPMSLIDIDGIMFVKSAFSQKRKTLVNNLYEAYHVDKIEIINFLETNQLSKNIRAEQLSLEDFVNLSKRWHHDY